MLLRQEYRQCKNDWLDDEQFEDAVQEIKRVGLRKGLIKSATGVAVKITRTSNFFRILSFLVNSRTIDPLWDTSKHRRL